MKKMKIRWWLTYSCCAMIMALSAKAQDADEFIRRLGQSLEETYVFEDKGKAMKQLLLDNLEKGRYESLPTDSLTKTIHRDLQAFSKDKHLAIIHPSARPSQKAPAGPQRKLPRYENGFSAAKEIKGVAGYLDIIEFMPLTEERKSFLEDQVEVLSKYDNIIVDLRNTIGGDPRTVQWVCSYFFPADESILLNTLEFRSRGIRQDFFVIADLPGKRLNGKKVYILTSDFTFSGGEELAYNLQQYEIATIVGEATGGGAHPVIPVNFEGGWTAMIPMGRAINPISKTNWEGVGVLPHHKMDESEALDFVLKQIEKQ